MLKILNIVIEQKNSYVRVLLVQDWLDLCTKIGYFWWNEKIGFVHDSTLPIFNKKKNISVNLDISVCKTIFQVES